MLRTNLATRPFYNDRAVRLVLGFAAAAVIAFTTFNILRLLELSARQTAVGSRLAAAEAQTAEYRQKARGITTAVDKTQLGLVQQAAREANELIDRRAFSWTDLFNRFEQTLPPDVRIAAVEPQIDREGRLLLAISVVARSVEDLNDFMDALEARGGFRDVISRQDDVTEDGMLRSIIQGYYQSVSAPAAAAGEAR